MKTRNFNLIILDESGSMQSIKKEAIDSVNETEQTIVMLCLGMNEKTTPLFRNSCSRGRK